MNQPSQLRAGAARVDITPGMGIQLAGDIGRKRPVEEIRERLFANALAVECGGQRLCVLSIDLLATTCAWSDRIRRGAAQRYGLPPAAIMLHVTQNHAAPSLGHLFLVDEQKTRFPAEYPWLMGGDEHYHQPTVTACIEAIGKALENLEPVELAIGHGVDGRVAFNRRFVMRDGTTRCHPARCDPNILHIEGPTDPEVAVATFTSAGGKVIAALLHHTCHPCHGYPHRFVIGDWPGAWVERMRGHWGGQCVPLVINGCCGNIHHMDHLNPQPLQDHQRMAELLTQTTTQALERTQTLAVKRIDVRQSVLQLALREPSADQIAQARALLAQHPEPMWNDASRTSVAWDWVYAVTVLDLDDARRGNPHFPYEIQVFQIGDLSLAALMGEPFVEGQLQIKNAAPTRHTLVAHFCNGYVGYVPTRRAFAGGGYETRTGAGSKLSIDALERITETATALLNDQSTSGSPA